jgi:hypothetical protein
MFLGDLTMSLRQIEPKMSDLFPEIAEEALVRTTRRLGSGDIMSAPILKAFVLCDEITDSPGGTGQKDLRGAGLTVIHASSPFPIKRSFWVYLEMTDQKLTGSTQLALMRADSGRRLFFRVMPIEFRDQVQSTLVVVRIYECSLPAPGVYFVELWYDGEWHLDQRFEVV